MVEIKKLNADEGDLLKRLICLYAAVFGEELSLPDDSYLQHLLQLDHVIFFIALQENKIVGGLTAHVLPSVYYPSSEVYVYDLAVDEALQRQGIGSALMRELQNYCRKLGYRTVFVQADAVDQHALDFYEKIGGKREDVFHFDFPL